MGPQLQSYEEVTGETSALDHSPDYNDDFFGDLCSRPSRPLPDQYLCSRPLPRPMLPWSQIEAQNNDDILVMMVTI